MTTDRPPSTVLERLALEAIGVILLFVIALGVLNRIEFGSFD